MPSSLNPYLFSENQPSKEALMQIIKDLLSRLTMFCRLEVAMVKEIESQDSRIRVLEENRKAKDQTILMLQKEVAELKLMLRKQV